LFTKWFISAKELLANSSYQLIKGGNLQIPKALIQYTNASLYLNKILMFVTSTDNDYLVALDQSDIKACDVILQRVWLN